MMYPRVYLAFDNCLSSKRWTRPEEWGELAGELGVSYVEASADNEIDPLYATPQTLEDWAQAVDRLAQSRGVRVANLYSGHGTYATLGLAHHDGRARQHIREDWLKPMLDTASRVGAGLGFFCHAFCQSILDQPTQYAQAVETLYDDLAEVARYAGRTGRVVGLEQMYTPHQIPWTLDGADELMRQIYRRAGWPMQLTLDTGHAIGQQRFLRPGRDAIEEALARCDAAEPSQREQAWTGVLETLWVGSTQAHRALQAARDASGPQRRERLDELEREMDAAPHLFAQAIDGDVYEWARRLGCHSPIVHLQQTDGNVSSHWPFTPQRNAVGIIEGRRYLRALAESYQRPAGPGEPPRVEDIHLTIEVFASTACHFPAVLEQVRQSVVYWRQFIPQDGVRLDELPCVKG